MKKYYVSLILLTFMACQTAPVVPGTSPSALPTLPQDAAGSIDHLAAQSTCAAYNWKGRGRAPLAYIQMVAKTYAKNYCAPGVSGRPMSDQAESVRDKTDAVSWYNSNFVSAGLGNDPMVRKTYTLLMGLGMRESSGNFCEGRDTSASNTSSDTAEGGVFQTSWNSHVMAPELLALYKEYMGKKLISCSNQNYGDGDGAEFQRLSKEMPEFATSYAAIMIRVNRSHYGPLNRKEAEVYAPCADLLANVEKLVKCP